MAKKCGYCGKKLPKENVCKESGCMYKGMEQLNPEKVISNG